VKGKDSVTHPNTVAKSRHLSGEILIGNMDDLLKLMNKPVDAENFASSALSFKSWVGHADMIISVSLAY
jgi:hypothetical protein